MSSPSIDKTVIVGNNVVIGKNVTILEGVIIRDNVVIEDDVVIGPNSIIGERLSTFYKDMANYQNPVTRIGKKSLLRSHAVVYAGTILGEGFETGHFIVIREHSRFGENCMFGNYCQTDEKVQIGNCVRCHSRVFLATGVKVGDCSCLYPGVFTTNVRHPPYRQAPDPPQIGARCIIGAGAHIMAGTKIGDDVFVGSGALVTQDIPDQMFAIGSPARVTKHVREIKTPELNVPNPYPFDENIIKSWRC